MGEVRHAERPSAKVKEKPVEPPAEVVPIKEPEWNEMGDPPNVGTPGPKPFDGRTYLVKGAENHQKAEALWRTTRRYDTGTGKWIHRAFWSLSNSGGQPLQFVPTHWREFDLVYMTKQ